jgi:hypothetical protein
MKRVVSTAYTEDLFERASTRMLPLANRAADYAPMTPACCNACRMCATSGAVGLIFAGAGAAGAFLARFGRRLARPL